MVLYTRWCLHYYKRNNQGTKNGTYFTSYLIYFTQRRMHMCIVQHGKTPLMIACFNEDEVSAALLMEATKEAGALDVQVTEQAWVGVSEGCG